MALEGDGEMKIELNMDALGVKSRIGGEMKKAQRWLDNEVAKDCEPYVPYDTGALTRSVYPSAARGEGQLVYNTPYARNVYYAVGAHFKKSTHPQACAQWFEKAKAVRKEHWVDGANKIMGGK